MVTKIISPMTACSHSHLLHPFCSRQNSTEKVTNFVLYAFGAAVACWALYQMRQPSSSPSRRTLGPQDAALQQSAPRRDTLNLAGKSSEQAAPAKANVSLQKGVKVTPTPDEIADHFCNIVKAAAKGQPVAYNWEKKNLPVSQDTPRFRVISVRQEEVFILNTAAHGLCLRWTPQVESNMRKGIYPEGMERKTLLEILNAKPYF
jgi:hypothetical protein